jgi:hypothetical protein
LAEVGLVEACAVGISWVPAEYAFTHAGLEVENPGCPGVFPVGDTRLELMTSSV